MYTQGKDRSPALKNEGEIKLYFRDTYSGTPCISKFKSRSEDIYYTTFHKKWKRVLQKVFPYQKEKIIISSLLGINTSSRAWLTTKYIFSKSGSLVEISHAHSFKDQWVTAPKVLVLAIDQGQTQQKYELVHDLTLSFCSLNMQATIDV